jgi:hypothetical protein
VLINGKEERHSEGAYYLEWREGATRARLSVGKNAADASARRQPKQAELNARINGVGIVLDNGNSDSHKSLLVTVADYLADVKLSSYAK